MSLLVRTCSTERVNVSRILARAMIAVGGVIWAVMFFSAASVQSYSNLTYNFSEVMSAGVSALIPLILAIGVSVLAMFYERLAALILFVGAAGVVVYGIIMGWGALLWASALLALAVPMVVSGALLLLAASTQRVCELEGKM